MVDAPVRPHARMPALAGEALPPGLHSWGGSTKRDPTLLGQRHGAICFANSAGPVRMKQFGRNPSFRRSSTEFLIVRWPILDCGRGRDHGKAIARSAAPALSAEPCIKSCLARRMHAPTMASVLRCKERGTARRPRTLPALCEPRVPGCAGRLPVKCSRPAYLADLAAPA